MDESYELIQKIARNNYDSEFGKNENAKNSSRDLNLDEKELEKVRLSNHFVDEIHELK